MVNWEMLGVFIFVFGAVSVLGFWAAHWRSGDLHRLQEWGLGGRRFGTIASWFLLGGDIYTAYSFIAAGLCFWLNRLFRDPLSDSGLSTGLYRAAEILERGPASGLYHTGGFCA